MSRLDGKVAAITGGASGIGEATARLFVAEGAQVVLGDIQAEQGESVAGSLGDAAAFATCDVSEEDDVAGLVDLAVERYGKLDVMFNNAGIVGARGPLESISGDEWRRTIAILLDGVFYGMKHAARVMKPQRSGSIISMASTAGVQGGLGPHAYAASKHAVVGLTKNAGAELCRFGIRANCIAPHSMATPMVAMAHLDDADAIDSVTERLTDLSPLAGRPGLPTDVAQAALWLASDESGYTNGHCLTVDAGLTTGSRNTDPAYAQPMPFMREAGRTGL